MTTSISRSRTAANWYPISRYSGGEIDMIAVSVRVAISEYLMRFGPDGESYSFLILDEVFGSQDQEHREKMIQMLRSLEERFPQIIAISHISDVQGQFDNTLLVVEDELGNSRVEAMLAQSISQQPGQPDGIPVQVAKHPGHETAGPVDIPVLLYSFYEPGFVWPDSPPAHPALQRSFCSACD